MRWMRGRASGLATLQPHHCALGCLTDVSKYFAPGKSQRRNSSHHVSPRRASPRHVLTCISRGARWPKTIRATSSGRLWKDAGAATHSAVESSLSIDDILEHDRHVKWLLRRRTKPARINVDPKELY